MSPSARWTPDGSARQAACASVQSPQGAGASGLEIPRSSLNALADCSRTVAADAFHPKRPSRAAPPAAGPGASLVRPETPSPSASSGSAPAAMSAGWTASSRPSPIMGGATRGERITSGAIGPYPRSTTDQAGRRRDAVSPPFSATGTSSYTTFGLPSAGRPGTAKSWSWLP